MTQKEAAAPPLLLAGGGAGRPPHSRRRTGCRSRRGTAAGRKKNRKKAFDGLAVIRLARPGKLFRPSRKRPGAGNCAPPFVRGVATGDRRRVFPFSNGGGATVVRGLPTSAPALGAIKRLGRRVRRPALARQAGSLPQASTVMISASPAAGSCNTGWTAGWCARNSNKKHGRALGQGSRQPGTGCWVPGV